MLRASCTLWIYVGMVWVLGVGKGAVGLIEIVEEHQCHDKEFRLTCSELETHIAILEAWYTSIEDLLINSTAENQTDGSLLPSNDEQLNQVYVYSSPNHDGYYEIQKSSNSESVNETFTSVNETFTSVNETFESLNDTFEVLNDIVNESEGCGVMRDMKSYASWKHGVRKRPTVYRDTSINLRAPVTYRCTGVNHCSFILNEDYPPSLDWARGVVYIKYACFDDLVSVHYCNREVTVADTGALSEGYVRTPGYPHFYVGDECRWKLKVDREQLLRLTFLDVSLRSIGPFEKDCTDYVSVVDSNGDTLFSSCDQVEIPLQLVSTTNEVEIIVSARSEGAFPKRGILFHYKSVNCVTLAAPSNGYLVYRNNRVAHYVCNMNHVFVDTRQRARNIWCYDDNRWNDTVTWCVEDTAVNAVEFLPASPEEESKLPPTEANMIVDIVIPSLLIAALFIGNAFIVLIIYKYRKRKTEDIEDEFNTIPLNVNGNMHSAGNAV